VTDRPPRRYLTGTARRELAAALRPRYEAGATIRDLANETGRSYGGIRLLLLLAGTELRPWGFQPKTQN
jgi:hypothetical protein